MKKKKKMAGIDKFLNIKYKLKTAQDFDEFLKFAGINLIARKALGAVSPVFEITKNGDTYTITMETAIRTVRFSFKLNEEFIDNKPNGEKTNTIIQADGDSLIQSDVAENGKKSKITYSFTPQVLILTNTIEGWDGKAVRTFEAI